jgi:hypothetical protein
LVYYAKTAALTLNSKSLEETKAYGKIRVTIEQSFTPNLDLITMQFLHNWSTSDYRAAALDMYLHMKSVSPKQVYVIADFSHPQLSFRHDILGPVWVDSDILQLSVDAPENRKAIYLVFSDPKLLNFAKFAASASQRFINDIMQQEYIVDSVESARGLISQLVD